MKNTRSAFTLVELLVVIAIIGILMGLLIPAVNAARETARRNQCSTQIKNLALAAIQYENAKQELPGYLQSYGRYTAPGAMPFDPSDPKATAAPANHVKLGTWTVALLPWLDAQPTYEHWTQDRYPILTGAGGQFAPGSGTLIGGFGAGYHPLSAPNMAIMQCPSNPNENGDSGRNSYIANNGMVPVAMASPPPGGTLLRSMERSNGAFNNKYAGSGGAPVGPAVRLDDFKDGQGNTMLFSENTQAMPWNMPGLVDASALISATEVAYQVTSRYGSGMVWHYQDREAGNGAMAGAWNRLGTAASVAPAVVTPYHRINGAGPTVSEDIFVLSMNPTNAANLARPSSAHSDGVNAAMADGGTRFIVASIDYRVYQALLTLRGKASDVPWPEFVLDDDAY